MAARLSEIRARIGAAAERTGRDPSSIRLVAVSKYAEPEDVLAAYRAGQREFGESRVQVALPKIDALPADVVWHMVGHLQSNKVNKVLGRFDLIQSVDTPELAQRLSEKSATRSIVTPILAQINCSGEESKAGIAPELAEEFVVSLGGLKGIVVQGLMTMAPLDGGREGARRSFAQLSEIHERLLLLDLPELPLGTLSMGMSGDFEVAVEEGANLLRIGGAIFRP
ncbi:MAG: YggS family pyridoxal phosphate-dependent enzyme [bacterium]|nr:YggS family pyridoxal phosphate-dependent enzyme [bacterium]